MIVLREMRRRAKVLVAPVLGLGLTGYFAYHLVEGDRGLRAWLRITQELRLAKATLAVVDADRAALDHKVSHMRRDRVDPDLLDSQVRRTLDVAAPNEIVIMQPPDQR
ncbi:MAG TPA: septum formation initiator family protein [Stellaceae bacterium]|jgi:cell division protein FtsB|nr:septum formation initiator family protein [Stellaceae bacterium]